ncbi:Resolvase domain protein [Mycolicibacterium rhodesiae JS60]|nr:Resolvase domain protein [Mycolicibacterium rhodesiae JS60]
MTAPTAAGQLIGYVRVSITHQTLDAQTDTLTVAGVDPDRVYSDKLSGTSAREQRPGLAALLDYARAGDVIVVAGIDRLGRNAAEVMLTIRELGERGIVLRSIREGIDTSTSTGRMIAGVLASLAELELELGKERRAAAREARRARNQPIGRPKALSAAKLDQVLKLHAAGGSVMEIAKAFGVGRDTIYRAIRDAENAGDS